MTSLNLPTSPRDSGGHGSRANAEAVRSAALMGKPPPYLPTAPEGSLKTDRRGKEPLRPGRINLCQLFSHQSHPLPDLLTLAELVTDALWPLISSIPRDGQKAPYAMPHC